MLKMKCFQLIALLSVASLSMAIPFSYYHIDNLEGAEYEYEATEAPKEESLCKCQNGGICVLDNDFCACKPGFTGRRCEISTNAEASQQGCGRLLNGETEFLDCAKCTCANQFLTCIALSSVSCENFLNEKKTLKTSFDQIKGGNLNVLIKLMNDIENDAYLAYINEYRGYLVEVKNVEIDTEMSNFNYNSVNNKKRLVVFQANKRVLSLYFPTENTLSSSSSTINIKFNYFFISITWIISFLLIR